MLCGLSHDMTQLAIFRGLQGIGGGMIFAVVETGEAVDVGAGGEGVAVGLALLGEAAGEPDGELRGVLDEGSAGFEADGHRGSIVETDER